MAQKMITPKFMIQRKSGRTAHVVGLAAVHEAVGPHAHVHAGAAHRRRRRHATARHHLRCNTRNILYSCGKV